LMTIVPGETAGQGSSKHGTGEDRYLRNRVPTNPHITVLVAGGLKDD
jgi:hypothetical protein